MKKYIIALVLSLSAVAANAQIVVNNQPYVSQSGIVPGALGLTWYNLGAPGATDTEFTTLSYVSNFFNILSQKTGAGTARSVRLGTTGSSNIVFQTNSSDIWQFNSSGNLADLGTHTITAGSTISASYLIPTQAVTAVANVGANSCGTTTATIVGTNESNVITVGATSGTQCRIQFATAATTEWDCVANDSTTTVAVRTTPVDTTHTDVIGTFTAGDKITTHCWPR